MDSRTRHRRRRAMPSSIMDAGLPEDPVGLLPDANTIRTVSNDLFVPPGFVVPGGLTAEQFRLEPLGPQHNAADYGAWTASIDHIQATPGFTGTGWPHPMGPADNLRDLERHA